MNSLKNYVDRLFLGYKESNQIRELKDEILSNLEAKVADLSSSGMEYKQAVKVAIKNMDTVDGLIDDNKKMYINRFKIELLQIALMYSLIAWILTIPIGGKVVLLNLFLLIVVIVLGIAFLSLNRKTEIDYLNKISIYNVKTVLRYKKLAWFIWGLFIVISTIGTSAIQFGSNIWFSRPVSITGPYQFTIVAINYLLPFISILVPLLISQSLKLFQKYEVGDTNEE